MSKLSLIDPTDEQLNVAFATEIAGWRDVRYEEDEDVDIDAREIYPWKGMAGWPPDGGKRRLIPNWTGHLDIVLPWLNQWRWDANWHPSYRTIVLTIKPTMQHPKDTDARLVESNTLPRAATIALLQAHGVEITFTKET